jgi:outer membrane biosynthesis protein TonB
MTLMKLREILLVGSIMLPVLAPSLVEAQQVQVQPAGLSLSIVKGQVGTATLSLSKTGTQEHIWEATKYVPWLTLSKTFDTITSEVDQVVVTVNTSSLNAGTYGASVYFTLIDANNGAYSRIIPVSVTVTASGTTSPPPPPSTTPPPPPSTSPPPPSTTPPPPPSTTPPPPPPSTSPPPPATSSQITPFPGALSFSVAPGQVGSAVLSLSKTGTEEHIWDLTKSGAWIGLSRTFDTIRTEVDQITVTVNTVGLAAGSYSGMIYIGCIDARNVGYQRAVPVSLTVGAGGGGTTSPPPPPPSTSPPPPSTTPPPPPPSTTPPPPPPSTSPPPPATSSQVTPFPAALSLSIVKGQVGSAVLSLSKTGTDEHVWDATKSASWISLSRTFDTIRSEVDQITVSVNSNTLNLGTYSGTIYFGLIDAYNVGYTRMVPISVNVTASGTTTTSPPPPPSTTPPPPPPLGGAGGTQGTLTITWLPNSEADLANYRIYIGTSSGSYGSPITVSKGSTSYIATLTRGYTYFVTMTAVDSSGNESAPAAELSRSLF